MTSYVLGFCFDARGENVVLIKKTKPAWQAGKWNGVGGKIEENELGPTAMEREFQEETGVATENWNYLGQMLGVGWSCFIYYLFDDEIFSNACTTTDEEIGKFFVTFLPETISNVPWLIQAALNHRANSDFRLRVEYK